ncbi:hypothetical protein ACLBXB_26115 [Methylobacterium mesophilicum]
MLMQDEEWAAWSDREIARRCAVSTDTVGGYRKEQGPSVEIGQMDQPRTIERGGKIYTMDTGRIGPGTADPRGEQDVQPEPPPAQSHDNVIHLGNRLNVIPSPQAIARVSRSTSFRGT